MKNICYHFKRYKLTTVWILSFWIEVYNAQEFQLNNLQTRISHQLKEIVSKYQYWYYLHFLVDQPRPDRWQLLSHRILQKCRMYCSFPNFGLRLHLLNNGEFQAYLWLLNGLELESVFLRRCHHNTPPNHNKRDKKRTNKYILIYQ